MNQGDIYLATLDPTEGREQQGRRAVLIVAATKFNAATALPVILPITNGGAFARRLGFAVEITGISTTGIIRCDQPRVIDLSKRDGRKVDVLPSALLADVLARMATVFG